MGNFQTAVHEASAAGKATWISVLKSEVAESPLALNVVCTLILTALEKLVEMEFACPCNPSWSALLASAVFVVPPVTASVLIWIIKKCNQDTLMFCFAQLLVWQILVFFDGSYFACAKTEWSGRFVYIDKTNRLRWCEPTNNNSSEELLIKTHGWYSVSQGIGFILMIILILGTAAFKFYEWRKGKTATAARSARRATTATAARSARGAAPATAATSLV